MSAKEILSTISDAVKEAGERISNPFILSYLLTFAFINWWFFYLLLKSDSSVIEIMAYIKVYQFDYLTPLISAALITSARSLPKLALSPINEGINTLAENFILCIKKKFQQIETTTAAAIEDKYRIIIKEKQGQIDNYFIDYAQMEKYIIEGYKSIKKCSEKDKFKVLQAEGNLEIGDVALTSAAPGNSNLALRAPYSSGFLVEGLVVAKLGKFVLIQTFGFFKEDWRSLPIFGFDHAKEWRQFFVSTKSAGKLVSTDIEIPQIVPTVYVFGLTDNSERFFISRSGDMSYEDLKKKELKDGQNYNLYKDYMQEEN